MININQNSTLNISKKLKPFYSSLEGEQMSNVKSHLNKSDVTLGWITKILIFGIYKTFLNLLRDDLGYGDNKRGIDDLFFFHYDWRLDNAENAINLGKEILGWKKDYTDYVKKNYPNYDIQNVKFNIVAHSMGGMIAMYYALKLDGLQNIGKLILIASPLQGSMATVKALKDGEDIGFGGI